MPRVLHAATAALLALAVGASAQEEAAVALRTAKREKAETLARRGAARAVKQDWIAAETLAREAIAVDKMVPEAWHGLGYALTKQLRWSEATAAFDEALLLRPDYAAALEALGRLHAERGNVERAEEMLERLDDLDDRRAATLRHAISEAR